MHWLMIFRQRPGTQTLREAHREAHRHHVATGGGGLARVLIGAALTEDDAETPLGNFGILEAPDRASAEAFAQGDPLVKAGVIETVEVIALASRFQAQRIDPMTK